MKNDTIAQGAEDKEITDTSIHLHGPYVCLHAGRMKMKISVELREITWSTDEWWEPGLSASIQGCVHHL